MTSSDRELEGGPAFPMENAMPMQFGLTKFEWFVGCAIKGLCANADIGCFDEEKVDEQIARRAFDIAAATIQLLDNDRKGTKE